MDPLASGDAPERLDRILVADIDHMVRTQSSPQVQPGVPGPGEDHGLGAQGLAHGHTHESDRAGTRDQQAVPGNQTAQHVEAVHGRAGSDD